MATRSISTYQPAVPCDVCGRNLLRGEQPDVFLAAGQRRMVCELCQARAAHEGWLREADAHPVRVAPSRGRRRTLMGRLRSRRAAREAGADLDDAVRDDAFAAADAEALYDDPSELADVYEPEFDAEVPDEQWPPAEPVAPQAVAADAPRPSGRRGRTAQPHDFSRPPRSVHAVPTNADFKAARALEVFNASEHPRRVSGVARSLGVPQVTARPITPDSTVMTIVVAWELCWYRYEVDLGDERSGARLVSQGAELEELDAADRVANATADDRGELRMLAL
jgi:hypothetical protein